MSKTEREPVTRLRRGETPPFPAVSSNELWEARPVPVARAAIPRSAATPARKATFLMSIVAPPLAFKIVTRFQGLAHVEFTVRGPG